MTDTICLTKILWKLTGRASLVAQRLKRLPAMQETWVQSLGREDPLEKEMAIHSSILAWRIPWTEELGGLQSMGSQRVGHNWATSLSLHFHPNVSSTGPGTDRHSRKSTFYPLPTGGWLQGRWIFFAKAPIIKIHSTETFPHSSPLPSSCPLKEEAFPSGNLFKLTEHHTKLQYFNTYYGLPRWLSSNLPANAGDIGLIPGLGRFMEKEMATHSSILAQEVP